MSEMIERVARAMHASFYVGKMPESEAWASYSTSHKSGFFDSARAVIKAMREPTFEMVMRSLDVPWKNGKSSYARAYRAMIDKALE